MKKITNEQFSKMEFLEKKSLNPFIQEIEKLEVGEHIFLSVEEYQKSGYKTSNPIMLVQCSAANLRTKLQKDFRIKGRILADKSGWVFTRKI